ncbi:MAG TPA: BrnT family toxin [Anaeromyxobacteraceae bacterium]|nr:BrnT family toxin [Anaeromyxobacteraceae bacterium]
MKLVTEPDVAPWLGKHPAMDWDAGNSTKSQAKHGFSTGDVESLLDAPVLFAGRIVEPAHEEARYLLLGVTASGRRAALIFARRGDTLRPISCRAMRKKEKEAYDAAT